MFVRKPMAGARPARQIVVAICGLIWVPQPLFAQEIAQDRHVDAVRDPRPPSLFDGFRDPPASARPRVWWHWLDGNISREGITKDLEWMKRIGLGGVQNFDGSFHIRTIVDKRVAYMSPEWQADFRHAAELSDQLGLELAVAGSPGWSESGGPWVKPANAMKKFVWSEIAARGGRRFDATLPHPPTVTGPFQDIAGAPQLGVSGPAPVFYSDAAVFAYRVADVQPLPPPAISGPDGGVLDATALAAGVKGGLDVAGPTATTSSVVMISFAKPTTVRSLDIVLTGNRLRPVLEAGDDGVHWRKVADVVLSSVPSTISFAPQTARLFRLVTTLAPVERDNVSTPAVGFAGFPAPKASIGRMRLQRLALSAAPRVNQFQLKAAFAIGQDYPSLDTGDGDPTRGVAPSDVVDLSARMRPDGRLDWTPPKGDWRIVRIGYSLTGATNHPATPEATGLEVDKLDAVAVRDYLTTYLGHFRTALGDDLMGAHGLKALVNDSTEVGPFNWTPRLIEQFQRLRGYDPRPWLPALTGALVGSRGQSDAFLDDFRRTIADLHASQHYGTIASVAHENGLRWYSEANEGGRETLGDDMDMRRYADVPMAAMWTYPPDLGPRDAYLFDTRGASSTAHVYGQVAVAAESMTSSRHPWADAPSDLRRVADAEFANGINLPVILTSIHQPTDQKPGISMLHIGQFFNRNESWAEMAGPWVDYLARNAFMLQQGRPVADVAYFYGEQEPTPEGTGRSFFADAPRHYGYDYVNATVVNDALKVDDGDLVAPSGARYRVIFLSGTSDRMTLAMLRRIATLARDGATIVGSPPAPAPSIDADARPFAELVRTLWSGAAVTTVGKGKVVAGRDVEAALRLIGVAPGVGAEGDGGVRFVHRALPNGDAYFLLNPGKKPVSLQATFRSAGRAPELWRADTGTVEPLSYRIEEGRTVVPLDIGAEESFFVVFDKPAAGLSRTEATPTPRIAATLAGPWDVTFEANRGAPPSIRLSALAPLSANSDPGVRYFSGIATYRQSFKAPASFRKGMRAWLDLGKVGDLAEVRVNGRLVGSPWHAPFRVDLGAAMHPGRNSLEVRVADLWVNRLVGDAQPGARKVTFTITPTYRADTPLRPSGLIGPVTIMTEGHE